MNYVFEANLNGTSLHNSKFVFLLGILEVLLSVGRVSDINL